MKKKLRLGLFSGLGFLGLVIMMSGTAGGCKIPESVAGKSGAQLWGENCNRCHNAPDPRTYSDDQWDVTCEHMRQKAILTEREVDKIKAFLKTAN